MRQKGAREAETTGKYRGVRSTNPLHCGGCQDGVNLSRLLRQYPHRLFYVPLRPFGHSQVYQVV